MRQVVLWLVWALVAAGLDGFLVGHSSGVATAQETATQETAQPAEGREEKPVKPSATVFLLDCSYSMSRSIERALGQPETVTQLEVASKALEAVLDELAQAPGPTRPQVGVWLFGHRVGWTRQGERVVRSDAADGPIPVDLAPAEDVERILPLGSFSRAELEAVSARLDRLEPHGVSPVNLAILRALEELGVGGGNVTKRIVVMTDGRNDQWHPADANVPRIQVVSEHDVIHAWQRLDTPIPISINYLGEPGNNRELEAIAKATGGRLLQPKTGAEIAANLRVLSRGE